MVRHHTRVGELALEQRLPDSGDVAVTEDSEEPLDDPVLDAVTARVLLREEWTIAGP